AMVATGSYVGTGAAGRVIDSLGFAPDVVLVTSEAGQGETVLRTALMTGDLSCELNSACNTNRVQALLANGYQGGSDASVNAPGQAYDWVAMRADACTPDLRLGVYTGNGADARSITGLGFEPTYVLVKQAESSSVAMQRFAAEIGDASVPVSAASEETTNRIEALLPGGFQIGTHTTVNAAGKTYFWVAWEEVPGGATSGAYV